MENSPESAESSVANDIVQHTIALRPGKPEDFKYPLSGNYRWGMLYFVKSFTHMTAHYLRNNPDHNKQFTKHYNSGHMYVPENDLCRVFEMNNC